MTVPDAGLPELPGGYAECTLTLRDQTYSYLRPADPDALLDDPEVVAACEQDGDAPYWALPWPPAEMMAAAVANAHWKPDTTILEVGCGIALIGLAAASRGWTVTVSDNRPEALPVAVHNAARNGLSVEPLLLDWRRPLDRRFDVILGCEVIYDAAFHAPLLATLQQMLGPGGEVWLGDFGRMHTPLFAQRAKAAGFDVELRDERNEPLSEYRTAKYQLLILRRS